MRFEYNYKSFKIGFTDHARERGINRLKDVYRIQFSTEEEYEDVLLLGVQTIMDCPKFRKFLNSARFQRHSSIDILVYEQDNSMVYAIKYKPDFKKIVVKTIGSTLAEDWMYNLKKNVHQEVCWIYTKDKRFVFTGANQNHTWLW